MFHGRPTLFSFSIQFWMWFCCVWNRTGKFVTFVEPRPLCDQTGGILVTVGNKFNNCSENRLPIAALIFLEIQSVQFLDVSDDWEKIRIDVASHKNDNVINDSFLSGWFIPFATSSRRAIDALRWKNKHTDLSTSRGIDYIKYGRCKLSWKLFRLR